MTTTDIDVVIYGATGFTGQLIAEEFKPRADALGLRWAIAGRNEAKLQSVHDELALGDDVEIIVADSDDDASLAALVERTRLVIAAAGPYQLYGTGMVAACAASGTHYVDLAGEPAWIRLMIDAHHETAASTGARIVHCCGVDSIPSDLGVHLLQTLMIEASGSPADRVKGRVLDFTGAASGGTVASIMTSISAAMEQPELAKLATDPFALAPGHDGPAQPDMATPAYDDEIGAWVTSFVMAAINTKVVHRSNQLLGHRHHPDLRYDEMLVVGDGDEGQAAAIELAPSGGMPLTGDIPQPGEGPDRAQREAGSFTLRFTASHDGGTIGVDVTGHQDPGYGATSKMISDAAITLLLDVPDAPGGSWTPAAVMADELRKRLTDNGVLTISTDHGG